MTANTFEAGASAKRQKRYKLYFWLMDACLVFAAVGLADFIITETYAPFAEGDWPLWYRALAAVSIFFSFFVAPFLILARFMRDEYAEQLWRRTTDTLVYVAFAAPFLLFAAATIVYIATRAETAPYPFSLLMGEVTWYSATATIWKSFALLFVGIFEFLRLKDAR